MDDTTNKKSLRDPERSREAILDAAEKLFAAKGYEETSLQEIGQLAGVSRGTPNYFFGSKEQLYGAVLDRVMQAEIESVSQTMQPAATDATTIAEPTVGLAFAIGNFLDFLISRPSFILLIEREALNNARFLQKHSAYLQFFRQALDLVETELKHDHYRRVDPLQLLLSITALCWFPLAHKDTILRPFGIDATDPAFWQLRKQHIVELVLYGVLNPPSDQLSL